MHLWSNLLAPFTNVYWKKLWQWWKPPNTSCNDLETVFFKVCKSSFWQILVPSCGFQHADSLLGNKNIPIFFLLMDVLIRLSLAEKHPNHKPFLFPTLLYILLKYPFVHLRLTISLTFALFQCTTCSPVAPQHDITSAMIYCGKVFLFSPIIWSHRNKQPA